MHIFYQKYLVKLDLPIQKNQHLLKNIIYVWTIYLQMIVFQNVLLRKIFNVAILAYGQGSFV